MERREPLTRTLVTGSAGHLGEALVRTLRERGRDVAGLDRVDSPFTTDVGSIDDPAVVEASVTGADVVLHAATLHKPHVVTHALREFVATNVRGTLELLEAAVRSGVRSFVFTSTTSVFGRALRPGPGEPAVWVTEELAPVPKNIYGVTKRAAEELCELYHRSRDLPVIVLRASRFFPEPDDDRRRRDRCDDANLKANEFLHRRVDLADVVDAHLVAAERAEAIGFGRYIVSATPPFERAHRPELRSDAAAVVRSLFPDVGERYRRLGWTLPPSLDRVYDNRRAREELGWEPAVDFEEVLRRAERGEPVLGRLAEEVGVKGYHDIEFADGPYPVDSPS